MRGKGAARLFPGELAELDREGGRRLLAQLLLQAVDLLVGERPVHRAVGDAIAVRGEALFGVREGVDQVDPLDELAWRRRAGRRWVEGAGRHAARGQPRAPATPRPSSKKSLGSKPSSGSQKEMSLKQGGYLE